MTTGAAASSRVAVVGAGLAGLRALQTETGTRLTGNWSWAPYWIMAFAGIVLIALAIRAITRGGDEL